MTRHKLGSVRFFIICLLSINLGMALPLIGTVASSLTLTMGAEWLQLSDWSLQQRLALFEAFDSRGFPYRIKSNSDIHKIAKDVSQDFLTSGKILPADYQQIASHLFVSCTRDSIAVSNLNKWYIGLPLFFTHKSVNDVNRSAIKLRHSFNFVWSRNEKSASTGQPLTDLQWESDPGQELLGSLVSPSEASLKFVLARQLLSIERQALDAHITSVAIGSLPMFIYGLTRTFKKALKAQHIPKGLSVLLGCASTFIVSFGALTAFDFRRCQIERSLDRAAASVSRDYAQGGVTYYNQLLTQNRALRQLQIDSGDWKASQKMSPIGDPVTFIRQKNLPISSRRDVCVKVADSFKN